MKIINLQAENFKRLKAIEIAPNGNMVEITGKNGNGKTSVLDAIWVALAGLSVAPARPIRTGEAQARIRLDLGEIIVTRVFKEGKQSTITVENAEGSKFPSPQSMLDSLLGQLAFDPLGFARMDAKAQFNTLRRFVPDVDFDKIDAENKADYTKRTELNRRAKEARTLAESIIVPTGLPLKKIDETALIDQLEKAAKQNADIETRKGNRQKMTNDIANHRAKAKEFREQAARLIRDAEDFEKEASAWEEKLTKAGPLPAPTDVSKLRQEIDEAKRTNANIALKEEKQEHIEIALAYEKEATGLTDVMAKRESEKQAKIAAAKLPVDGISFGEGEILFRGVPFSQASDAEQLRISISIAMASNSKLRVIRVRDGSLLDDDSMKILAEMAREKDYQVWIERVDSSGKIGFVLEDGKLKSTEKESEPEEI